MADSFRKNLKRVLSGTAARFWARPRLTPAQLRARDFRRILVVRQHNQMGDMVCATPCFRALRETFPGARIALVCAPLNRDVVLHNPHLDGIFNFDKAACRDPRRLAAFLGELRRFRPDAAFVLNSVSFSVTSAALAAASGAPVIVGGDSRPFGYDISRHAFSLEMPSRPALDRHAVLHCLAPLEAVGITTGDLDTVVESSDEDRERADALLRDLPGDGPVWALHPGAGKTENLWPAERFAELAARAAALPVRVLVLQGPADGAVTAAFARELASRLAPGERDRVRLLPVVPVGTCVALLRRLERFACNDTGLMHVAGAVGVPTLALFGPTDPDLWKPRTPAVVALRDPAGDLRAVGVDAAWEAWRNLPAAAAAADPATGVNA